MTADAGPGPAPSGLAPSRPVPHWESFALWLFLLLLAEGALLRAVFAVETGQLAQLDRAGFAQAMLAGLRFDAAIAALLALFTTYALWLAFRTGLLKPASRGWLVWPALALYLMQTGDMLYARESGRHVGYEIVELARSRDDLWRMLPEYTVFLLPALPLALALFWWRVPMRTPASRPSLAASLRSEARVAGLTLAAAFCIRSGIHTIPLSPADANALGNPARAAVALNGAYAAAYNALHAHQAVRPPPLAALPADEEKARLRALYAERVGSIAAPRVKRPLNIVVVFLESWPAELVKSYGGAHDVAPAFDALRAASLTTDAMIAGGHRTVEGLFSTLCSYQNPEGVSVPGSQLLDFPYRCLPQVLGDAGWSTAFFQGGHRNSAMVGVLVEKLGVRRVYGKEDMVSWPLRYPANSWGPHDADLFDFVLKQRESFAEPYFIGINTTTTHDETLPPGVTPAFGMDSFEARTESVMHFADQAVGEFAGKLTAAKTQYPTLLVLVSDHTAHVNSSPFNHYRIVFALYAPGLVAPQRLPFAASQRDIAPTLLDLAGLAVPDAWAGKSLLAPAPRRFAEYQHAGHSGWIEGDALVDYPVRHGEPAQCYRWREDALMQHALPCSAEDDAHRRDAIAFSHYAHALLFSGKTADFTRHFAQDSP